MSTGVYVIGLQARHFHTSPECFRIRAGRRGRPPEELRQITLDELTPRMSPCATCYPDAPRIKVHKPYCRTCASAKPCVHNGGVLVLVPRVWRAGSALLEPGEITYAKRYVWPSRAHRYQLA